MWLRAAAAMIPHPSKREKGGEDAYFIYTSDTGEKSTARVSAVGVADGVGGWASQGVDAGIYARQLCAACFDHFASSPSSATPVAAMQAAQESTSVAGSSTCIIAMLQGRELLTANLGDSGFLLLRGGGGGVEPLVIAASTAQQHGFNFPFQLQFGGRGDQAAVADQTSVLVEGSDLILLGSDGLFDNLFTSDILSCIARCRQQHPDRGVGEERVIAEAIVRLAHHKAADPHYKSPFAVEAAKAGKRYHGGKMDDITVVIATVCEGFTPEPANDLGVGHNQRPGTLGQALAMPNPAARPAGASPGHKLASRL